MRSLVTLAYGRSVKTISASDSYAVTLARMNFASEHGIQPAEVGIAIEHAAWLFDETPTAAELAIINAE